MGLPHGGRKGVVGLGEGPVSTASVTLPAGQSKMPEGGGGGDGSSASDRDFNNYDVN